MTDVQRPVHPALRRLEAFVGEWALEAVIEGKAVAGGRTVFEWSEGGAFLVQHAEAGDTPPDIPPEWIANSPFPVTTMFGLDDTSETFTQLYADARGVYRVYQMTFVDGVWTVWREAPGFHQRYIGRFSEDGTTIAGAWEKSPDGKTWEKDFDSTYRKVR